MEGKFETLRVKKVRSQVEEVVSSPTRSLTCNFNGGVDSAWSVTGSRVKKVVVLTELRDCLENKREEGHVSKGKQTTPVEAESPKGPFFMVWLVE